MIKNVLSIKMVLTISIVLNGSYSLGMNPYDMACPSEATTQLSAFKAKGPGARLLQSAKSYFAGLRKKRGGQSLLSGWASRLKNRLLFAAQYGIRFSPTPLDPSEREENQTSLKSSQEIIDCIKSGNTVTAGMINNLVDKRDFKSLLRDRQFRKSFLEIVSNEISGLKPEVLYRILEPAINNFSLQGWTDWICSFFSNDERKTDIRVAYEPVIKALRNYALNSKRSKRLDNIVTLSKASLNCFFDTDFLPSGLTPTQLALFHHLDHSNLRFHSNLWFFKKWFNDPALKSLFGRIVQAERFFAKKGYVTFLHGHSRNISFLINLYTRFRKYKGDKVPRDYIYPFVRDDEHINLDHESQLREKLVNGKHDVSWPSLFSFGYINKNLLFSNFCLFAGNSPALYMDYDRLPFSPLALIKKVFNTLDLSHFYHEKAERAKALLNQYVDLDKYGHLLMIAVPRDQVDSTVYLARADGNVDFLPISGEKTSQPSKIIKSFYKDSDLINSERGRRAEFVMPATYDKILNPQSGIKVFSFEATDQNKLSQFNSSLNAFAKSIGRQAKGRNLLQEYINAKEDYMRDGVLDL